MTRPFPSDAREASAVAGELEAVAGSLDAAWREAEAALPEGWIVAGVYHIGPSPMMRREFEATAWGPWLRSSRSVESVSGYGETSAAALRVLAVRLRERAK